MSIVGRAIDNRFMEGFWVILKSKMYYYKSLILTNIVKMI